MNFEASLLCEKKSLSCLTIICSTRALVGHASHLSPNHSLLKDRGDQCINHLALER